MSYLLIFAVFLVLQLSIIQCGGDITQPCDPNVMKLAAENNITWVVPYCDNSTGMLYDNDCNQENIDNSKIEPNGYPGG